MFNDCGSNFLSFEEKRSIFVTKAKKKKERFQDTFSELSKESMAIIHLLCSSRLTNKHPSAR